MGTTKQKPRVYSQKILRKEILHQESRRQMILVLLEGPGTLECKATVPSMEALVAASRPGPRPQSSQRQDQGQEWISITKLGHLVTDMKVKSLEIYLFSLPIKESEITDYFLEISLLKDEDLKIMSMQKQTCAHQQARFKAFAAIRDYMDTSVWAFKCSKEEATAVHGAIILAKLSIIPMQQGYWGNKTSKLHTVPCKVTGHCGSLLVCLTPAPVHWYFLSPCPRSS